MSDSKINDIVLVKRVQQGDKNAFNLLVSKYQYRIRYLVSRFVSDTGDQEDVVQETFIKAYRALPDFRGDSAFYTWLYKIATNTAKNYLISNSKKPPKQDIDIDDIANKQSKVYPLIDDNSPDQVLSNNNLLIAIQTAINELPNDLKRAIILRELDGMTYDDIAVAMNCPIGTVRSRIFRAREIIENKIAPLINN